MTALNLTGGGAADTLDREARLRPRSAALAVVAAVLFVIAAALQLTGPRSNVGELTVQLITINRRAPLDVIAGVVQALALGALAWMLTFLWRAARARRPEMTPVTWYAMLTGAALSAICGIAYSALLESKAHTFVTQGSQTYVEANHLTSAAVLPVLQTLDIAAQFALEIGLILIALNAMRVGLLTRFMGYCGIVAGVAGMLLIGQPPALVIEVFWLLALAVLFLGRWPNGEPPSWRTGQAEPWPSAAQLREQRMQAAGAAGAPGGRAGRANARTKAAASKPAGSKGAAARGQGGKASVAEAPAAKAQAGQGAAAKRKRKRRR